MKARGSFLRRVIVCFSLAFLILWSARCGENGEKPISPEMPSGPVSYSKDIQPIFNANCNFPSCHGSNPPSGLLLTSYEDFVRGGTSGRPFIPGDSASSLIIRRLTGEKKPRMPLNRPALSPADIGKISAWIDGGGEDN